MRPHAVEREVVIVGGGLVGLMTALLLTSETKLDVCVFADDSPEPRTDSQRNHAWLQSGLLYVGSDILAARHMYSAGRAMHRQVLIEPPSERGVFRYDSEEHSEAFLRHAYDIRLANEVRLVPEVEARRVLGSFFRAGCANYEVPDCPFNIGALMNAARDQARAGGATFRVEHVELEPASDAPNGYRLETSQEVIETKFAVICTGSGTPFQLEKLGLKHPLVINRSGLLVLPQGDSMSASLLADRSRELSYVRHSSFPPNGRLVVGDKGREVVSSKDGMHRELTPRERQALLDALPPVVRRLTAGIRATACHKTDRRNAGGRPTVEPWVMEYPDFPGLIFATPGKATMALYTAREIVKSIVRAGRQRHKPKTRALSPPVDAPPGKEWRERILPHFHPEFDGLDDTTEEDPDAQEPKEEQSK